MKIHRFSFREAAGQPQASLPWEPEKSFSAGSKIAFQDLWKGFVRGSYPELVADPGRDIQLWYSSYIQTYLERDVRSLRQVGDLTQFQSFLRALAAKSAQLISMSNLAKDLGVAVNTVRAWLSVLEATYKVIILRPYHANIGKRLVKTPKVYFTDVGTLCHLAGLKDQQHAAQGPMGGPLIETAVLSEITKALTHRGVDPRLYFWRTSAGSEVDIVAKTGEKLVPIEVKLSATPRSSMASSIKTFKKDFKDRVLAGYLIHPGDVRLPLGEQVTALPFYDL